MSINLQVLDWHIDLRHDLIIRFGVSFLLYRVQIPRTYLLHVHIACSRTRILSHYYSAKPFNFGSSFHRALYQVPLLPWAHHASGCFWAAGYWRVDKAGQACSRRCCTSKWCNINDTRCNHRTRRQHGLINHYWLPIF